MNAYQKLKLLGKEHPRYIKRHLYFVWTGMVRRCLQKDHKSYKNYGRRGITVCKEWNPNTPGAFESFVQWSLNNSYKIGLQLDRIDNNGNYEPGNCMYVTPLSNGQHKRNTKHFLYNGTKMSIMEIVRLSGISDATFRQYIDKNGIEENTEVSNIVHIVESRTRTKRGRKFVYKGNLMVVRDIAEEARVSYHTLRQHIKQEKCLEGDDITPLVETLNQY